MARYIKEEPSYIFNGCVEVAMQATPAGMSSYPELIEIQEPYQLFPLAILFLIVYECTVALSLAMK